MKKILERLYNGIIKENPTFVLTLGMCPTLAVTTSAINGLGMGLTTAAVLALSNLFISVLRKVIPDKVRIPAFIVIVASFVTMIQLLLEAYLPSLNASLGIYIPLIVVNCIILGRAESYAYHNPPVASFFDGVGMGLGFTIALTLLGIFREFIGSGTFFGIRVFPEEYGVTIFVLAPGAFFVLAALVAVQNYVKDKLAAKGKDVSKIGSGCASGCMGCPQSKNCSRPEADKARNAEAEEKRKAKKEAEAEEKRRKKLEALEAKKRRYHSDDEPSYEEDEYDEYEDEDEAYDDDYPENDSEYVAEEDDEDAYIENAAVVKQEENAVKMPRAASDLNEQKTSESASDQNDQKASDPVNDHNEQKESDSADAQNAVNMPDETDANESGNASGNASAPADSAASDGTDSANNGNAEDSEGSSEEESDTEEDQKNGNSNPAADSDKKDSKPSQNGNNRNKKKKKRRR